MGIEHGRHRPNHRGICLRSLSQQLHRRRDPAQQPTIGPRRRPDIGLSGLRYPTIAIPHRQCLQLLREVASLALHGLRQSTDSLRVHRLAVLDGQGTFQRIVKIAGSRQRVFDSAGVRP